MLWMHLAADSWIEIEASVQIHTMQFNIAYLTAHDNGPICGWLIPCSRVYEHLATRER